MFSIGIIQRNLHNVLLKFKAPVLNGNGQRNINRSSRVIMLCGGLGKMQGGIKEEEYFSYVNYMLMCKIREQFKEMSNADYMQNWDEYQKTLDQAGLINTCLMNKHKNCKEEAYFMNENAECCKIMKERANTTLQTEDFESEASLE